MGNGGAAVGQQAHVLAGRPVHPRVMVEEDAVADDRMLAQHADIAHPLNGGAAVAADHLLELVHRLGGVGLPGQVLLLGVIEAVAQQVGGAGVDLRRRHHAHQAARGMLVGKVDGAHRLFHPGAAAAGLVPVVLKLVAVIGVPFGVLEHRSHAGTDAGFRQHVEPGVEREGIVDHRGDAAGQQLGHGDPQTGGQSLGIVLEDGEELVERGVEEAGAADLVGHALAQRLAGRVGVDVDEARHHHALGAVHLHVDLAGIAAADLGHHAAGEDDVAALQVDVAALLGVPGDDPGGVADDGGAGGGRTAHGGTPFYEARRP